MLTQDSIIAGSSTKPIQPGCINATHGQWTLCSRISVFNSSNTAVHPFWYHCLELWWLLLMNCGWQVSLSTLLLMQRMLSVQWNPVFHQDRLSALFHHPMRLSFNHLMYFMLSEVNRTKYVFCIENWLWCLWRFYLSLLIMNIETMLQHVHSILQ
jgi:hypothetical protein